MSPEALFHSLVTAPQLGQLLRSCRRQQGLTQAAVATQLGLSQNRLSHLELHPDQISVRQLLAWCAALGLRLQLAPSTGDAQASSPEEW